MALAYLLDEHLRGPLWWAIQRHNARNSGTIDAVRVGDPDGPSLGAGDPEILLWAEQNERILVTLDENSMPGHLINHLHAGHHSPGVFTIRPATNLPAVVEYLILAAFASDPQEWADRIAYVP